MTLRCLLLTGTILASGSLALAAEDVPSPTDIMRQQLQAALVMRSAADSLSASAAAIHAVSSQGTSAPVGVGVGTPVSTTQVFNSIFEGLMTIIAAALTGIAGWLGPKLIATFEKRVGIQLTESQKTTIQDAINTAKGIVETQLDQGIIRLHEVTATNPKILEIASEALDRVPNAAAALNKSIPSTAQSIVGLVDTLTHSAPIITYTPTPIQTVQPVPPSQPQSQPFPLSSLVAPKPPSNHV